MSTALIVQSALVIVQCIIAPIFLFACKRLWDFNGDLRAAVTSLNSMKEQHDECRRDCKDHRAECKTDRKAIWGRLDQHTDKLAEHDREIGVLMTQAGRRRG